MAQAAQKTEMSPAMEKAILPKDRLIEPSKVLLAEHGFRNFFIRLPIGLKHPQDVNDTSIWTRVQGVKNLSLRKHDHL